MGEDPHKTDTNASARHKLRGQRKGEKINRLGNLRRDLRSCSSLCASKAPWASDVFEAHNGSGRVFLHSAASRSLAVLNSSVEDSGDGLGVFVVDFSKFFFAVYVVKLFFLRS